jgi:Flp pilus assembly protein TadB
MDRVHSRWASHDRPTLITEAPLSVDAEFNHRRRRYLLTMFLRAVCVVGAALTVQISGLLSAAFIVGALVLPWMAVLLANDRPPRSAMKFRRFLTPEAVPFDRQLAAPGVPVPPLDSDRIIDL